MTVKVPIYFKACGKLGERLFLKSEHMRKIVPGCKVIDGHAPAVQFSNLENVKHQDWIIYEPQSMTIRGICEVKTTTNLRRTEFEANGDCATVLARARQVRIRLYLAIVRLISVPPQSILTRTEERATGLRDYFEYLPQHPSEYRIELYQDGEFELRTDRFVIYPAEASETRTLVMARITKTLFD
jgi:hypothetical protein